MHPFQCQDVEDSLIGVITVAEGATALRTPSIRHAAVLQGFSLCKTRRISPVSEKMTQCSASTDCLYIPRCPWQRSRLEHIVGREAGRGDAAHCSCGSMKQVEARQHYTPSFLNVDFSSQKKNGRDDSGSTCSSTALLSEIEISLTSRITKKKQSSKIKILIRTSLNSRYHL